MAHCGSRSVCQSLALQITEEVKTISGIDCSSNIADDQKIALIEAKRAAVNTCLDGMINHIKQCAIGRNKAIASR